MKQEGKSTCPSLPQNCSKGFLQCLEQNPDILQWPTRSSLVPSPHSSQPFTSPFHIPPAALSILVFWLLCKHTKTYFVSYSLCNSCCCLSLKFPPPVLIQPAYFVIQMQLTYYRWRKPLPFPSTHWNSPHFYHNLSSPNDILAERILFIYLALGQGPCLLKPLSWHQYISSGAFQINGFL